MKNAVIALQLSRYIQSKFTGLLVQVLLWKLLHVPGGTLGDSQHLTEDTMLGKQKVSVQQQQVNALVTSWASASRFGL